MKQPNIPDADYEFCMNKHVSHDYMWDNEQTMNPDEWDDRFGSTSYSASITFYYLGKERRSFEGQRYFTPEDALRSVEEEAYTFLNAVFADEISEEAARLSEIA